MSLATGLLFVGFIALSFAGVVFWLQLVQPTSRFRLPMMLIRSLIGCFAIIGMGYIAFIALFRTSPTVTICDPRIPIAEQPCQTIQTNIDYDSGDGIFMIPYVDQGSDGMKLTGCNINWDGNPWGDSTPCKNAETGEELIAVVGPKAYNLRWE